MTQSTTAGPAVEAVTSLIGEPDPFLRTPEEVESMQVDALRERFAVGREVLPLIERRAQDGGIDEIKTLADIVPLLLAHSTYKTYDERFIERGQWDRLLRWYGSLAMVDVTDTDLDGVADIDDFIDRLHAAGHFTMITGGTGGKCSFFNQTARDLDLHDAQLAHYFGWPDLALPITNERVVFQLAPIVGPTRFHESFRGRKRAFARPGMAFGYGDIAVRASDLNRLGQLRRAMGEGLAGAGEIEAFECESVERAEIGNRAVRECVQRLIDSRHEPCIVSGSSREYLRGLLIAEEMGFAGGDFHPETVFSMGGGFKGGRAAWGSDMTVPGDAWSGSSPSSRRATCSRSTACPRSRPRSPSARPARTTAHRGQSSSRSMKPARSCSRFRPTVSGSSRGWRSSTSRWKDGGAGSSPATARR